MCYDIIGAKEKQATLNLVIFDEKDVSGKGNFHIYTYC